MRVGPPDEMIPRQLTWRARVRSWLGGRYLGEVPAIGGRVVWTLDSDVQGSLQNLTVPAGRYGEWVPGTRTDHPLARYGQQLQVSIITGTPDGLRQWETPMGRFQIEDWDLDADGNVSVSAHSMLQRWASEAIATPTSTGGSLSALARRLVPTGCGLIISPDLTDRTVKMFDIGDSRMDTLGDLADAWPCRVREDDDGNVLLLPPLPDAPDPVLTLRDGEGGTVVSALPSDTRSGAFNQIIARSTENRDDSDLPRFQAVATQSTGPLAAGVYGVVTKTWASPLVTTQEAAALSAQTMLRNNLTAQQVVPISAAPDPRPQLDDAAVVRSRDLGTVIGVVRGVDMPLTIGDGDMRLDVGVIA